MAELNMALLLKESLNNMRGKLGKDCTYLAFEKEGDLLFLCAKLKNELGGTDKIRQKTTKHNTRYKQVGQLC